MAFRIFGFKTPYAQKRRLQLCQDLAASLTEKLADDLGPKSIQSNILSVCTMKQMVPWLTRANMAFRSPTFYWAGG